MERPIEQLPIYKKSKEIERLVDNLIEFVKDSELPNADDFDLELLTIKFDEMKSNTSEISDLIVGASEQERPYDYCMENAVFIKKAALELIEAVIYIEDMGLKDIDYLDLLYDEIDAFRLLFKEWIQTFDQWLYGGENWGLFLYPGIQIVEPLLDDDDFDDEDDEYYEEDDDDDDDDFDNDEDY